jgi:hypothetical protein
MQAFRTRTRTATKIDDTLHAVNGETNYRDELVEDPVNIRKNLGCWTAIPFNQRLKGTWRDWVSKLNEPRINHLKTSVLANAGNKSLAKFKTCLAPS